MLFRFQNCAELESRSGDSEMDIMWQIWIVEVIFGYYFRFAIFWRLSRENMAILPGSGITRGVNCSCSDDGEGRLLGNYVVSHDK